MILASVPLALSLAVAPQASTYDQATCATLLGGLDDGWERAAIGEDAPSVPALDECQNAAPLIVVRDCNDPLATRWVAEMIGICDMPRRAESYAHLRAARSHDERRAQRLLAELSSRSDAAVPVNVPTPEHGSPPALLASRPSVTPPSAFVTIEPDPRPRPPSITYQPVPPPPRA
jgi:hypothetical protein